MYKIPFSADT